MATFISVLDAEIADLERMLEANAIYMKLREARRLRKLYTSDPDVTSQPFTAHRPSVENNGLTGAVAQGAASRGRVVDASIEVLSNRTSPMTTKQILQALVEKGVTFKGASPQNTLSSLLSKTSNIKSNGRVGWTLVQSNSPEIELADDAGPTRVQSSANEIDLTNRSDETSAKGREAGPGGGT